MGPNSPEDQDPEFLEDLEDQYMDEDFYKDFIDDEYESDNWIEDFLEK